MSLGLVVLAVGCGGGSDDEFVDKASDLCLEYQQKIEVDIRPLRLEGYRAYLDDVLPAARRTRDAVADLEPPEDIAADVERMLENWDEILRAAVDLREQAGAGDFAAAVATLERMNVSDGAAVDAAHDAGIPACAEFAPFTSRS